MSLRYPIPATVLGLASNPIVAVLTPVTIGSLIGLVTRSSVKTWYPTLKKPKGQPPRWAFPVAWTYLYGTMGYASHLIAESLRTSRYLETADEANSALHLYFVQLGLNFIWTPIFFGLKKPGFALVDILALTGTVFHLTNVTSKFNPKAAYLLLPYCAWLTYATYLNGSVWYMNGGDGPASRIRGSIEYLVSKFSRSGPAPQPKEE